MPKNSHNKRNKQGKKSQEFESQKEVWIQQASSKQLIVKFTNESSSNFSVSNILKIASSLVISAGTLLVGASESGSGSGYYDDEADGIMEEIKEYIRNHTNHTIQR